MYIIRAWDCASSRISDSRALYLIILANVQTEGKLRGNSKRRRYGLWPYITALARMREESIAFLAPAFVKRENNSSAS